jgi:hypothetical protein
MPGFIEVERRVLRIAGAGMGGKKRDKNREQKRDNRDIRTRDVVLW